MQQPYAAEHHGRLQDAKSQQADNGPVGITILQCTHGQMLTVTDSYSSRPHLSNTLHAPAVP